MDTTSTGRDGRPDVGADFVEFVRGRSGSLLRAAFVLTGDQGLAEDLVQSALARTHLAWRRLAETGNAEAYTRKIMYHLQVDWRRRKRFVESTLADVPQAIGGDATDAVLVRLAVAGALRKLTPRQRAVLTLRFFEDQTEAEAALTLGCSVGTVKSQTFKALAKLRMLCPDLGPQSRDGQAPPTPDAHAPQRPAGEQFSTGEGATS
jgi:RNA polymerase sigma-70 factor (sigma-E family)